MKYLPVNVYTEVDAIDCTNNGITVTNKHKLVIECETGFITEETVAEQGMTILVPKTINDYTYLVDKAHKGHTMFGGNFVFSSDSRFRKLTATPIAVHDRVE